MTTDANTLTATCPKCGQPMALQLPIGADLDAAKRLARAIVCASCWAKMKAWEPNKKPQARPQPRRERNGYYGSHRNPGKARRPYAD